MRVGMPVKPCPTQRDARPKQRDPKRMLRPAFRVPFAVPHGQAEENRSPRRRKRKRESLRHKAKQRDFAQRKRGLFKRFAAPEPFIFHRAPTEKSERELDQGTLRR